MNLLTNATDIYLQHTNFQPSLCSLIFHHIAVHVLKLVVFWTVLNPSFNIMFPPGPICPWWKSSWLWLQLCYWEITENFAQENARALLCLTTAGKSSCRGDFPACVFETLWVLFLEPLQLVLWVASTTSLLYDSFPDESLKSSLLASFSTACRLQGLSRRFPWALRGSEHLREFGKQWNRMNNCTCDC